MIIERDGVCSIRAGGKSEIIPGLISTCWINAKAAPRVAGAARQLAGDSPDASTATAALHRSAASLQATLTPDSVAIARAGDVRDYALVASPSRNHLNCGTVGTVMRGGAIGATLEAFPIPLGLVT